MTKSRHGNDCPCVECEHEYNMELENKGHQMTAKNKVLLTINEADEFIFDNLEDAQAAQTALNKSVFVNGFYDKDRGYASFKDGMPTVSITTNYDPEFMSIYPDEKAAEDYVKSLPFDEQIKLS